MSKTKTKHPWMVPAGVALTATQAEDKPGEGAWNKVAIAGSWKGHWQGAFSITKQMLNQIVEHFTAMKNDTLVDYEHQSILFANDARAAGWINAVDHRDDGLYARIKWTDAAARHIASDEYRYLSPVIVFNTLDRKTGEMGGASLPSVALTNSPFLDELPEARLNSLAQALCGNNQQQGERMDEEQLGALASKLGLPADATVDAIMQAVDGLKKTETVASALKSTLGLPADATEQVAVNKVVELTTKPQDDAVKAALTKRVAELEAEKMIAVAMSEGKIVPTNREWAQALAVRSADEFKAWAASAPKVVPVETKTPGQNNEPSVAGMTAEEVKAMTAAGLTPAQWAAANKVGA